jgi:hypothetical protein
MFPFQEQIISDNVRLRTFEPSVSDDELVWHRDVSRRTVKVVESSGWYFQFDDELPIPLAQGDVIEIPEKKWHRVIRRRNSGKLIVEITE